MRIQKRSHGRIYEAFQKCIVFGNRRSYSEFEIEKTITTITMQEIGVNEHFFN